MDKYTILNIDPIKKSIDIQMEYQGKTSNLTIYMESVDDEKEVVNTLDKVYLNFQSEIDNAPKLKTEVVKLIGNERTADTVASNIDIKTKPQEEVLP